MAARIMRKHGEYCHRCHCEIQIGEQWYRYDGVRCTETRKVYHYNSEICSQNLQRANRGESVAYTYEAIMEIINKYQLSHNAVITNLYRGV